ncbi:MAG: NDP-hexose 2,3-dehydratase family protein [Candidatus Shapirobacteria bacterium]
MSWQKWLQERRNDPDFLERKEVPIQDLNDWEIDGDGRLSRREGGYFEGVGIEGKAKNGKIWDQILLRQGVDGLIFLIYTRRHYLLQAKSEIGNDLNKNFMLLAPTIQASATNLENGNIKYTEMVGDQKLIKVPQDGGRFLEKFNLYGSLRVPSIASVVKHKNFRWFTVKEITEAIQSYDINEHLLQMLGFLSLMT